MQKVIRDLCSKEREKCGMSKKRKRNQPSKSEKLNANKSYSNPDCELVTDESNDSTELSLRLVDDDDDDEDDD